MSSLEAEHELTPGPCFPFPFRSMKELINCVSRFWAISSVSFFLLPFYVCGKVCNDKNTEFITTITPDAFEVEAQGRPLYSY